MAINAQGDAVSRVLDKRLLRQSVAALQARLGLTHDPAATGEQAQAVTLASGLRPEDRVLSSEILRMRQEEKEQTDDILDGIDLIKRHNLNSTDAATLHAFLKHAGLVRASAVSVLIASDQRLLRSATAEGLEVLNPETILAADVPAFLAAL